MDAPSLQEVQRWMKARIRPDVNAAPGSASVSLRPQRGTPGEERVAVYTGGYLARTQEALAEVYEAVRHLIGARAFTALAEGYAARYPSHDYNLSFTGRHLPELLDAWPLTQRLPFLPDLARLEWLVCQAFHAFDHPALSPIQVAALNPEAWPRIRLTFQPSVAILASSWPVLDLWQARTLPRDQIRLEVVNRPQRVLVFRQGLSTRCELLDGRQYQLLEGLLAGRTLGEVCGALAEQEGELPLSAWFSRWAAGGLLSAVSTGGAMGSDIFQSGKSV